jgi:magnesium chelatase family protein
MQAGKLVKPEGLSDTIILGELALDGSLRPIRGLIGKLLAARKLGLTTFYVPAANIPQAQLIPYITLLPLNNLRDFYLHLTGTVPLKPIDTKSGSLPPMIDAASVIDLSDIIGQGQAKRVLEIAAAGSHNLLLNGPPGTSKSMLAKALPGILPPMGLEEILEVTHLHSLASRQYDRIITTRPIRSPHHSASDTAIIGGGQNPRPGEISLAHRGILFFDEFPEFSRTAIESLRQPLEDRQIVVSRAKDTLTFPANFILIATSNPCPCGHYGTTKSRTCLPSAINRYQQKLSGPIIDRIDLYASVDEVKHAALLRGGSQEESSQAVRDRVQHARQKQLARYKDPLKHNASLSNRDIKQFIKLTEPAENLLNQAAERLNISARAYMRLVKVARTIADLDDANIIDIPHITEALQYRRQTPSL